jgi:hypothetical protein
MFSGVHLVAPVSTVRAAPVHTRTHNTDAANANMAKLMDAHMQFAATHNF